MREKNGIWVIEEDYRANLYQIGFRYTFNKTLNNHTFSSSSEIFIGDNVTLTINGTVNFNNSKVYLGENAKIEVVGSGKIIANSTVFQRLDPNKKFYGIKLMTNDNEFNYSTVDGGKFGLYSTGRNNQQIYYSTFLNNDTGIYLVNSEVTLDEVTIKNSTYSGISLYNSDVRIESSDYTNTVPTIQRSEISQNGSHGIYAGAYSKVWLYQSNILNNGSHNIKIDYSSKVYAGSSHSFDAGIGYNKFETTSTSKKYIYKLSYSSDGEYFTSWTVPAQKNYWGDGTTPTSSYFYGTVNYSNPLTEDPSVWHPCEDDDGNMGIDCPGISSMVDNLDNDMQLQKSKAHQIQKYYR